MTASPDLPPTGPETLPAPPQAAHGWLNFVVDFGPLLIFFLTYKFSPSTSSTVAAIHGTVAFMVAIGIAMAVSKWKLGKISPMLWMSGILVLGFGALTIYFHDERFIVMKPTIIYGAFASILLGGYLFGKPTLKYLLQSALEGITERGWMLLSRNWGVFFAVLGIGNHVMYELIQAGQMSFDLWLTIKVWGITLLSFAFTLTQLPVMIKNGLALPTEAEGETGA